MAQKLCVIFGVTDDRKPRAARFDFKDEAIVRKAAAAMNMRVGLAKSDKAAALAIRLPIGKLFESGVGLVPLVKAEVFYKLQELLSFDQTWNDSGVITGRGVTATPELLKATDMIWSGIKVGTTVVCFYGGEDEPAEFCWSAAVVTAVSKDGLMLDCRWRDWPDEKAFKAKANAVAIFRPDVCQ
jgi:hypothetical protein